MKKQSKENQKNQEPDNTTKNLNEKKN